MPLHVQQIKCIAFTIYHAGKIVKAVLGILDKLTGISRLDFLEFSFIDSTLSLDLQVAEKA